MSAMIRQIALSVVLLTEHRIELDPRHIGLRNKGDVASCALRCWGLRGSFVVRQRMVTKREESPAIGFRKSLAVLHREINTVKLAVEKTTTGGLSS
jgi:hypothetical protein